MKKIFKYSKFLLKHKYYVMIECFKLGVPMRGILHDISKFRPSEFFIYADYFYGKPKPEILVSHPTVLMSFYKRIYTKSQLEEAFDKAWLKHQHRNPHHWQYWILRNDDGTTECQDMPIKYIKEMVADWIGAGKAIHGKDVDDKEVLEWYLKNKNNIKLSKKTKEEVHKIMASIVYRKYTDQ